MPEIIGILLAGGRAIRLGGADKALLPLGGRPLLAHAFARLAPQCSALVLSANGDPARFAAFELPVVADDPPDAAGPLAGLLAALDYVAQAHPAATQAVSLPVDTPFAPADLVAKLAAARAAENAEIAVATSGGHVHHAIALWPVTIRTAVRTALAETGERSVGRFAARTRRAFVEWPAAPHDPFFNINTFDDLAAAERLTRP